MRASLAFSISLAAMLASGCTALIAPDTTRLGGDDVGMSDASAGDAGPRPDGGDEDGGDEDGGPPGDDSGIEEVDAGGCSGEPVCAGGTITRCEGGMPVLDTCPLGCAPGGAARCAELDPSNVDASLFDRAAPSVHVDSMLVFDTGPCASTTATTRIVPQDDGSDVCLLVASDFEITSSGSLRIVGGRPLVMLVTGDVDIDGVLDASARLTTPGPGGAGGGIPGTRDGYGAHGGRGGFFDRFEDGGGGGAGFGGAGGDGGQGGDAGGGEGGAAGPSAELSPLRGGSGGGLGNGTETGDSRGNSGLGGAGGGAIQITALGRIRVGGAILAAGGGGSGGRNGDGNFGAGGGGGSGGGILLEASVLEIRGALWTSGGGGGGGASTSMRGGDGEDGRTAMGPALGGTSGGTMYGATGGVSGALADVDGRDGSDNLGSAGNGGGGGGGVGCIVLRDATTSGGLDGSARLSPSAVSIHPIRLR